MIGVRHALLILVVAAMLLYVGGGHGAGTILADHEGMAGAEAGICLILVAFLIVAAVPQRPLHQMLLQAVTPAPSPAVSETSQRPDGRSRASPIHLQRFRN